MREDKGRVNNRCVVFVKCAFGLLFTCSPAGAMRACVHLRGGFASSEGRFAS